MLITLWRGSLSLKGADWEDWNHLNKMMIIIKIVLIISTALRGCCTFLLFWTFTFFPWPLHSLQIGFHSRSLFIFFAHSGNFNFYSLLHWDGVKGLALKVDFGKHAWVVDRRDENTKSKKRNSQNWYFSQRNGVANFWNA